MTPFTTVASAMLLVAIAFHSTSAFAPAATEILPIRHRTIGETHALNKRRQLLSWPGTVVRLHQSSDTARVVESANITSSSDDELRMLLEKVEEVFPQGEILTITMKDHRPLGCTIEESLNEEDDYVFISKITEGGNADKAGLRVGDVVVGVTGLFGELTIVMDSGVEKITRLVSSVPDEDLLSMQIVRGTNILERHETAIVDMCNMSGASEKEVENCVVDFLSGGYDLADDEEDDNSAQFDLIEDDSEDLIGDMYSLWADEVPLPPTTSGITDQANADTRSKKPKPWSSRSSGSGTWVRDPRTGQMRNIDS
ncbi:PDZ domain containing protein [Nitzschia inconspicua]|uniref:PDZ domain containing protein n=1 Tax=Nitzschia inconspicua TaxID=303405 RepID=A0A9K3PIZ8_9STRA|nr:PDZ domain containing protein [Nitzschia inconspicua]